MRDGSDAMRHASVCLVSMPFMPVMSPSLGISLLKAELAARAIAADVFYGSLEMIEFMAERTPPEDVVFDYNLVATSQDLGETLFAQALWPDGAVGEEAARAIAALLDAPSLLMPREQMRRVAARLGRLAGEAERFVERCLDARDWGGYRIVGFSSVFSQNVASLALARLIKARWPHVRIVFGGPNVDGEMGEELLRSFAFVDFVVQGEADHSFPAFVAATLRGECVDGIPGLLGRGLERAAPAVPIHELDGLPLPDFSDFFARLPAIPVLDAQRDGIALPVETSRGCWWGAVRHCVFCGLNPTTMTFRAKSPARAVAEFDQMASHWRCRSFFAVDNIIDMTYFRTVLPLLEERDYDIFYETKSNLKEQHVAQLARAGVRSIQPGIEGLSSEILRLMKKGVRGHQNLELLKWCRIHGVEPLWFYLYQFPGERAEPYLADIELMRLVGHLPPPRNPNPVVLDRYSPLYRDREAIGYRDVRPSRNAAIYYGGLDIEARSRLAYHFDATPPSVESHAYGRALWEAVSRWRYQAARAAFLVQIVSENSTLVLDGRGEGHVGATLLSGVAHRLHRHLRSARALAAFEPGDDEGAPTARDIDVTLAAAAFSASFVDCHGPVKGRVQRLVDLGLVVAIDGLHLALATDLVPGALATELGLEVLAQDNTRFAAGAEVATPQVAST